MKTSNAVLMQMALESLKGNWGIAIGTSFLYAVIVGVTPLGPVVGPVAAIIIGGPMLLGYSIFLLSYSRGENAELSQLFKGFNWFGKSLGAYLLMTIYVFLWSLLLIIPGIVAAFKYAMTFFILADDPTLSADMALKKSKEMMYGYKWKLFFLGLRFIGWFLLCILTLGIGFLWLIPYINVSYAKFYEDLKSDMPV
jgi:uncharacterized membrane protein